MRNKQRETTCKKIIKAALKAIGKGCYDSASTRAIADEAGISQGLLTYHFKSKDDLWCATADYLFNTFDEELGSLVSTKKEETNYEIQCKLIHKIVHFNAKHPEFIRFVLEHGNKDTKRMRRLSDKHIQPQYDQFQQLMPHLSGDELIHTFYALAGSSSIIYSVTKGCKRLTGVNPKAKDMIQHHAEYLCRIMLQK